MDQIKIGRFIAEQRKKNNLTQMQLAEKLNITDRAVSKWETGKAMPDVSIIPALCGILGITVNDLFTGEVVLMENYNKELENNLLELQKQKVEADKRLLRLEILAGILCFVPFVACAIVAYVTGMEEWLAEIILACSLLPVLVAAPFMLRIEQIAGYYECRKCGHRHVPSYKSVFLASHVNRTRHMSCPACGKKSWQKKVLTKEK